MSGEITYPKDHKPGMRVPKGGSSCASCEYLGADGQSCTNKYFQKWNGSSKLPAPADEYCSDWYEPKSDEKKMKKHGFKATSIELHDDGSATIHHIHSAGPHKDVKHAAADLDGIHDSFQEHLNPEKAESEASKKGLDPEAMEEAVSPGIHEKVAKMAAGVEGE